MLTRCCWLAVLLVACLLPRPATAQTPITIGEARTLESKILGERRELLVYLPPGYRSGHAHKRYPVLYFLDGEKFFHAFTGVVSQLASDATPRTPEMILVGIVGKDRVRDSSPTHSLVGFSGKAEAAYGTSGGGRKFLRFVDEELVPYIEREFSASDYRIYSGYSFTGLSPLDALFSGSTTFDAYIAIDPSWWWDGYVLERQAKTAVRQARFGGRQLFVAANGETYPTQYFPPTRDVGALADLLRGARPSGLDWSFRRYEDESHHSMPARALYDGLSHVFRGYKPTLDELFGDPVRLRTRYAALSDRLGTDMPLREDLVNHLGYQFLHQFKDAGKALQYFQMNVDAYPRSANAWDSLAEAHVAHGNKPSAIAAYERVLALDPGNRNAAEQLARLRSAAPVGR